MTDRVWLERISGLSKLYVLTTARTLGRLVLLSRMGGPILRRVMRVADDYVEPPPPANDNVS